MNNIDIDKLPINSIIGGWMLKNGSFYAEVKCPDGVIRTTIIPLKKI